MQALEKASVKSDISDFTRIITALCIYCIVSFQITYEINEHRSLSQLKINILLNL